MTQARAKIRMFDRSITVLVGHFGSGKTEIAVNEALRLAGAGEAVTLVDLDVVKPYFRSRSARKFLEDAGVELVAPTGENYYADLPIILPKVRATCSDQSRRVIMDVGGNDTGARVIGSLADVIAGRDVDLAMVLNFRRPFTPDVDSAIRMAEEIEGASRLKVTGILSNTHLMGDTTVDVVREGYKMAVETAGRLGVSVCGVAVEDVLAGEFAEGEFAGGLIVLERLVRPDFSAGPNGRATGPLFVLD